MALLGLALVLLSLPLDASLTGRFDNSSGGMAVRLTAACRGGSHLFFVAPPGSVYLGSVFMTEALQRATELTDAAYTRTSER